MNKEAKVGLTVIAVLMVIFIGVLARRLYISYAANQFYAAMDNSEENSGRPTDLDKGKEYKTDTMATENEAVDQSTVITASAVLDEPAKDIASSEDKSSRALYRDTPEAESVNVSALKTPPPGVSETLGSGTDDRYSSSGQDFVVDMSVSNSAKDSGVVKCEYDGTTVRTGRIYTAVGGESLFDVARCELGKASRWVEIYNLNVKVLGKDIDCLAAGTQIVLPNELRR